MTDTPFDDFVAGKALVYPEVTDALAQREPDREIYVTDPRTKSTKRVGVMEFAAGSGTTVDLPGPVDPDPGLSQEEFRSLSPNQRMRTTARGGAPQGPLPTEPPDTERLGEVGSGLLELVGRVSAGIERGVNLGFLETAVALGIFTREEADEWVRFAKKTNPIFAVPPSQDPSMALTEDLAENIGQVSGPAAPMFSFLRAARFGPALAGLLSESIGAAFGLDPRDPNLTGLIPDGRKNEFVAGLRDLLATDPNDSEWTNRARNFAENFALGGGFIVSLRAIAKAKHASPDAVRTLGQRLGVGREPDKGAGAGGGTGTPGPAGGGQGGGGGPAEPSGPALEGEVLPPGPGAPMPIPHARSLMTKPERRTAPDGTVIQSPVFYENATVAVRASKDKTAQAARWTNTFKNAGITDDEMQWTGLGEFLQSRKGQRIPKEEIERFLQANRLEVMEVMRRDPPNIRITRRIRSEPADPNQPDLRHVAGQPERLPTGEAYQIWRDGRPLLSTPNRDSAIRLADRLQRQAGPGVKWRQYTFRDGADYRELVAVLPPRGVRSREAFDRDLKDAQTEMIGASDRISAEVGDDVVQGLMDEFGSSGTLNFPEIMMIGARLNDGSATEIRNTLRALPIDDETRKVLDTLDRLDAEQARFNREVFQRGHFPEPNVLWHVRKTDRTGPNGEKVLFLEEVQSDWLQGDKLFRGPHLDDAIREAEDRVVQARAELDQMVARYTRSEDMGSLDLAFGRAERQYLESDPADPPTGAFGPIPPGADTAFAEAKIVMDQIDSVKRALRAAEQELRIAQSRAETAIPDAPFKDTWHRQAFRRMVRYAADNGYDAIAWTTGDQQVRRWSESFRGLYQQLYDAKLPAIANRIGKKHKLAVTSEDIGIPELQGSSQRFEVHDPHTGETIAGPFDDEDQAADWIADNEDFDVLPVYRVFDRRAGTSEEFDDLAEAQEAADELSANPVEIEGPWFDVVDETGNVRATEIDRSAAENAAGNRPGWTVVERDEPRWILADGNAVRQANIAASRAAPGREEIERVSTLMRNSDFEPFDDLRRAEDTADEDRVFVEEGELFELRVDGDHVGFFDDEDLARAHYYDHYEPLVSEVDVDEAIDPSVHYFPLNQELKDEARRNGFPLFTTAGGVLASAAALAPRDEAQAGEPGAASGSSNEIVVASLAPPPRPAGLGPPPNAKTQETFRQEARLGRAIRRLLREIPEAAHPAPRATAAPMATRSGGVIRVATPDDAAVHSYLNELGLRSADVGVDFNFRNITGPDDLKRALNQVSTTLEKQITAETGGRVSRLATRQLATQLDVTPEVLLRTRGAALDTSDLQQPGALAAKITAARMMLASSAQRLDDLATMVRAGRADEVTMIEFRRQMAMHAAIQMQVKGAQTEIARALSSFNIPVGPQGTPDAARLHELIDEYGGVADTRKMAERYLQISDPVQRNKLALKGWGSRSIELFNFFWINGLVSGPFTHVRNITGNTLFQLWSIPEHMIAAGLGLGRRAVTGSDDRVFVGEVAARFYGMIEGVQDGLVLGAKALRTGEPQNAITKLEMLRPNALSAEAFGMVGPMGKAVDAMGAFFGAPGRALMAEDEVFRAVAERAQLHQMAYHEAMLARLNGATEEEAADIAMGILRDPPPETRMSIEEASRYYTFTAPMGGRIGDGVRFVQRIPIVGRVVLPFGRTPVNIMKAFGERSIFAPMMPSVWRQFRAGGTARDMAIARFSLGSAVGGLAVNWALEGRITGQGPADPQRRAQLRETGWQPWSIVIDKRNGMIDRTALFTLKAMGAVSEDKDKIYVSYLGLEPLGNMLALSAAAADAFKWSDELNVNEDLAMVVASSFAEAFKDRSFFRGISDFSEALAFGPGMMNRYLSRVGSSFVPFSSLMRHVERMADPTLRETRVDPQLAPGISQAWAFLTGLKSSIPGLSDDLPPKRNLWGQEIRLGEGNWFEKINPYYISPRELAPVDIELIRLGSPLGLPQRRIAGVKLSPEQYDRLVVSMTQEVRVLGKTFKEAVEDLIQSSRYQNLTDEERVSEVQSVRDDFLEAAQHRLGGYRRGRDKVDMLNAEDPGLAARIQDLIDRTKEAAGSLPPF